MRLIALVSSLALSAACSSGIGPSTSIVIPLPVTPTPQTVKLLSVTRIMAYGNSITEGQPGVGTPLPQPDPSTPGDSRSYPFKLQQMLNAQYPSQKLSVYNAGKGGDSAVGSVTRLESVLGQLHPEVVILFLGENDLNAGTPIPAVTGAMSTLIDTARGSGAYVLLSTISRQRVGGQRAGAPQQIVPYNTALFDVATVHAAQLVDIYPLITDDLVGPDGLHLTEAANATLAAAYFTVIKTRFEYTAPK